MAVGLTDEFLLAAWKLVARKRVLCGSVTNGALLRGGIRAATCVDEEE